MSCTIVGSCLSGFIDKMYQPHCNSSFEGSNNFRFNEWKKLSKMFNAILQNCVHSSMPTIPMKIERIPPNLAQIRQSASIPHGESAAA